MSLQLEKLWKKFSVGKMDIIDLRNCLIRFLMWTEDFKNCDKSDMNDLETQQDELKEEILNLLKEE